MNHQIQKQNQQASRKKSESIDISQVQNSGQGSKMLQPNSTIIQQNMKGSSIDRRNPQNQMQFVNFANNNNSIQIQYQQENEQKRHNTKNNLRSSQNKSIGSIPENVLMMNDPGQNDKLLEGLYNNSNKIQTGNVQEDNSQKRGGTIQRPRRA